MGLNGYAGQGWLAVKASGVNIASYTEKSCNGVVLFNIYDR
jgi:hypothetical protein